MSDPHAAALATEFLAEFRAVPGIQMFDPLSASILQILPPDARKTLEQLPPLHRDLLAQSNGLAAWSGYFRLFGFGYNPQGAPDAFIWNMPNLWKFVWPGECAEYFCFGEDGWGNQYAYRRDKAGLDFAAGIFLLAATTLQPAPLAANFGAFLSDFFLPEARQPSHPALAAASQQFGPLALDAHIQYVPATVLGGQELPANLRVINARQAMILSGDIFSQLGATPRGSRVERIDTAQDRLGVMRLKLVFGPPPGPHVS